MRTLVRTLAVATASAVVLTACGVGSSAEPFAAKVNGRHITKAHLDRELNAIVSNKKYLAALEQASVAVQGQGKDTFDASFVARVLTRRVYLELVHQEVVKRNLGVQPDDLKAAREELVDSIGEVDVFEAFAKEYKDEIIRTTAEVNVLETSLAKVDTSPAAVKRYYDANLDQFEKVCASHILVATKKEADTVEKKLAKATDKKAAFSQLAAEMSTDTGSKDNGGALDQPGAPCASPAGYVPAFREAVRAQPIGVVGKPVKTQFGFHIIRVDSREPAPPLAAITTDVREALKASSRSGFEGFLSEASTKAKIEVNPRYGRFDRSGASPQVVPNDTPVTTAPIAPPGAPDPQNQPPPQR